MAEVVSDSEVKLTPTSGKEEGRRSKRKSQYRTKRKWPQLGPVRAP